MVDFDFQIQCHFAGISFLKLVNDRFFRADGCHGISSLHYFHPGIAIIVGLVSKDISQDIPPHFNKITVIQ